MKDSKFSLMNKYTIIEPFDVLLIDFGSSSVRSHPKGKHPAIVITIDDRRSKKGYMMVVPIFRKPSYRGGDTDIMIRSLFCPGLHYDMYMNVTNIIGVERYRAERRIGRLKHPETKDQIKRALLREVGGGDE